MEDKKKRFKQELLKLFTCFVSQGVRNSCPRWFMRSSSFSQGRPVPCRAQIWWIRAVPNISVPCPHDSVPCQIFPCRALMIRAQIWWIRAKKYGALFSKKKRLRQRTHKSRASRNMGAFFCRKKKRLRQRTHKLKLRASRNLAPLGFRPKNKVFERLGL